jgi:hypothetical protein
MRALLGVTSACVDESNSPGRHGELCESGQSVVRCPVSVAALALLASGAAAGVPAASHYELPSGPEDGSTLIPCSAAGEKSSGDIPLASEMAISCPDIHDVLPLEESAIGGRARTVVVCAPGHRRHR